MATRSRRRATTLKSITSASVPGTECRHARYWRCALQVNPEDYSRKYRGKDHGTRGQSFLDALVKECRDNSISMIGLADHGNVSAFVPISAYLRAHDIVVLPGFEVCSSEKIHWVCLFPEKTSEERLSRVLGSLDLLDPDDGARPSRLSGSQLLAKVRELGGISIAAHATNDKGVLKQRANHLWKDPNLDAAQIPGAIDGLPQEYRQIAKNLNSDYMRGRPLALINARDVAVPADLRKPECSCLLKMTLPSFEALKRALHDPESRVRLSSDLTVTHCGRIDNVTIDAGYLADLDVAFSPHLNAVIGGRGTGKSTLIECIRFALELEHKGPDAVTQGDAIVTNNVGEYGGTIALTLTSSSEHGARFTVSRCYGERARVYDERGTLSNLRPVDVLPGIEVYGQSEIHEIACDPGGVAAVLSRFVPELRMCQEEIDKIQRDLRSNARQLTAEWEKQEEISNALAELPRLTEKLQRFEAIGVSDKLALVPLLEAERRVPGEADELVHGIETAIDELLEMLGDDLEPIAVDTSALPHADLIGRIQKEVRQAHLEVTDLVTAAKRAIANRRRRLRRLAGGLTKIVEEATRSLEKEFKTLPDIGSKKGPEVGRAFQKLQRDIGNLQPFLARQESVRRAIADLTKRRRKLQDALGEACSNRLSSFENAVKRLNRRLSGLLSLRVVGNADRTELAAILASVPGVGGKSLEWLQEARDFSVAKFIAICRAGSDALQEEWGVKPAKARSIAGMERRTMLEIEAIDLKERVELELNIGIDRENFRPIGRLSKGQQCTAILLLLLLENQDPLIIDQPEDNLDNAFVADHIVRRLRSMKTERQFIFATHNANIPILGDAEWIGACTAIDGRGSIPGERQGSIDSQAIRDAAAQILDGGREAFERRREKYGY